MTHHENYLGSKSQTNRNPRTSLNYNPVRRRDNAAKEHFFAIAFASSTSIILALKISSLWLDGGLTAIKAETHKNAAKVFTMIAYLPACWVKISHNPGRADPQLHGVISLSRSNSSGVHWHSRRNLSWSLRDFAVE